jgi:hypothetical protein
MSLHEEELQKKIEAGLYNSNDPDASAYQKVFDALNKEPKIGLPSNFADKVIQRVIEKREAGKSSDFIWFGVGLLILLAGCGVAIAFISQIITVKFDFGFLSAMSGMKWFFVLAVVLFGVFNWLDKKMISKHHYTE